MSVRLQANILRDWRPGWRTGVAVHIATVSDIPRRKKRGNGDVYLICALVLCAAVAVAVYG